MTLYREPSGENVRVDSGIAGNPVVQPFFDPMIAKLIVHDRSRDAARLRMIDALQHYIIHGVRNNVSFLLALLGHKAFIDNLISTKYCDEHLQEILAEMQENYSSIDVKVPLIAGLIFSLQNKTPKNDSIWQQIGYWRIIMNPVMQIGETSFPFRLLEYSPHNLKLAVDSEPAEVSYHLFPAGKLEFSFKGRHFLTWISTLETGKFLVTLQGSEYEVLRLDSLPPQLEFSGSESVTASNMGNIVSPMPGRVIKINVTEGQEVVKGDVLLVVEAMKMENAIICPGDGVVDKIEAGLGDLVDSSSRLIHVREKEK
jgi:acetyl/propionyl-CoA carboxylase alpha subunit